MTGLESGVVIFSRRTVRPSPRNSHGDDRRRIDLTPWDLMLLTIDYSQKGLLFSKPIGEDTAAIIARLLSSFSRALDHFFPFAGRLATVNHHDDSSLSIFIDCNDAGAEFIHASAPNVSVTDIVAPIFIPPIVNSFFALNGAMGMDGHSAPLMAVQVTELSDGIFIGFSLNHAVADGTSFWHFFNSWSSISHTGVDQISNPPVLDRWFLDSCPPPIHLPYRDTQEFVRRPVYHPVSECFFHFPARSIANLKAKANAEMGTTRISSLQSLLAHVWRSVTRARGVDPQLETTYKVLMGYRARMNPPLPQAYLGNSVVGVMARALAGDVVGRGLGWAAWQLNQAVASQTEAAALDWLESWTKSPSFIYVGHLCPRHLTTASSPRFDMFGNDFGWGRPVAVRNGRANKMDGTVYANPGSEEGSMALEMSLSKQTLDALVKDMEFMEVVGNAGEV